MLNTPIIASQVANLTDARYYAAWGVAYMSFNRNQGEATYIPIENLNEIREWVEGPQFLGEFTGLENPEVIEQTVVDENLSGVILGPHTPNTTYKALDVNEQFQECLVDTLPMNPLGPLIIKLAKSDIDSLDIATDHSCYLDIVDFDLDTVKKIIEDQKYGLVLRGGEEEKVGFKSFGFLDDVYDLVMD